MRWVTHERVQIARLASAWLIRRFIDPDAEFAFVPRGTELAAIAEGIPFHVAGAELANQDGRGTFEVILDKYRLTEANPVLGELGLMVRVADAIHGQVAVRGASMREALPADAPPESAGLQAILHGSQLIASGDLDAIDRAAASLDAVYASLQARHERAAGPRQGER